MLKTVDPQGFLADAREVVGHNHPGQGEEAEREEDKLLREHPAQVPVQAFQRPVGIKG